MADELHLQATANINTGIVTTTFSASSLYLADVKKALGLIIKDLQEEDKLLPDTHARPEPRRPEQLAEAVRHLFKTMANSTSPHHYLAGALELADELERVLMTINFIAFARAQDMVPK